MRAGIASWRIAMLAVPIGLCVAVLPMCGAAASQNWLCFFESGSDALSRRCEQVLASFAEWWSLNRDGRAISDTLNLLPARLLRVQIDGHTDAAEAAQGLQGLGERRARAMAEWLIASGIPRELVSTGDAGATSPLVPTPPGIAEPQNRNAEIFGR